MSNLEKENAATSAKVHGGKFVIEEVKLPKQHTAEPVSFATFFWCKASGSVERMSGYPSGVAA